MSYEVKVRGKIGSKLVKLAQDEIRAAIRELRTIDPKKSAHATHEARKHLKKLRAVLHLVRAQLPKMEYAALAAAFREAGRRVQPLRDAHVRVRALDLLRQSTCKGWNPTVVIRARRILAAEERRALAQFDGGVIAGSIITSLRAALHRIDGWDLSSFRWKEGCDAIKRSYKRARDAGKSVTKGARAEDLHEWRKRAKELGYHARLLRRADAAWMDIYIAELKALTGFLGDDHDLAVLRAALDEKREKLGLPGQFAALMQLLELRRRELAASALEIGPRLFADSPGDFARRLAEKRRSRHALNVKARKLAASITMLKGANKT